MKICLKGASLDSNYVRLFVAFGSENYKQYKHSRIDEGGTVIKAGRTLVSRSNVLRSFSPAKTASNLDSFRETRILTDYAFPVAGVYRLKAALTFFEKESSVTIESAAIQIVVTEPIGDDLKIWNAIKNNGDIAYFLQENDFPSGSEDNKIKLEREIAALSERYPNGILRQQLNDSLRKFQSKKRELELHLNKAKQFK